MKNIKLLFYAVSIAVFLSSCVGKTGAPGAQGPQGYQGNANVQSQTTIINSWSYDNTNVLYYASLSEPGLNNLINNSGAVDVYFSIDNGNSWNAMPYTYPGTVNYFMTDAYSVGTVEVDWIRNSGTPTDPNTLFGVTVQIKVVLVAPSVIKAHPHLNWSNYNEVQSTFHL